MRILIIADDEIIAKFLKLSLQKEGFIVDVVTDCEKGSFLALTNNYALVILDNIPSEGHGKGICQNIRRKKSVPIIILSVKSEVPIKVELFDAGIDDFISKPFSFDELMARIRAILRRPQEIRFEEIEVGSVVLNSKKHEVRCGKYIIHLAKKEFALLEYLMRHKNEVISKTEILENLWDMNANPFSNTVESHIRSIRRKLEVKGVKNLIKTIPGVGYKIEK